MRRSLAIGILTAVITVTGCAPESGVGSPSTQPPPSAPTPTAQPSLEPSTTPTPVVEDFTDERLVALCLDVVKPAFDADVVFSAEAARVEAREVDPPWLVLIPAQTQGFSAEALCTIGGTPQSPVFELANGSLQPKSEQEIEDLIAGTYELGGS